MAELWSARERLVAEQPWKPVGQAGQLWRQRRDLITRLEFPHDDERKVVKAVRGAAIYRSVMINVDAVARAAGQVALTGLAAAVLCAILAGPHGPGDVVRTLAGLLVGLPLCLLPVLVLMKAANHLTMRRPSLGSSTGKAVWSLKFLGAVLATMYAANHPAGFVAGLAWAVPAFVLASATGEIRLVRAGRKWHNDHDKRMGLYAKIASEELLVAAGRLTADTRAWRTAARSAALARDLERTAARIAKAHQQLARGKGWGQADRADRALIRSQACRLQLTVLAYRRELTDVTSQTAYDDLLARAKRDVTALADNAWADLPPCPPARAGQATAVEAVSTAALGAAVGLAVNAASEHLPAVLDRPGFAWAAAVACTVLVAIFRRGGWNA
jgi:hypothetical protein